MSDTVAPEGGAEEAPGEEDRVTWMKWASAVVLAGASASAVVSCDGEHRPYERELLRARAGADAGVVTGAAPAAARDPVELSFDSLERAPGEACEASSQCNSGFCVDGVCCRSSCDTVCSRCDGPGTEGECTVAANDAACNLSCPANSECRSYGSGALTANCEAVGLCRSLADCQATDAPAGTACLQGTGACDGQGECVVQGKKRLGEACADDAECGQGHCVVGGAGVAICCDAECSGLCQTCGATGRCNETPRDDARCQSVDCPDDNLCRDYVADLDVNLCRGFAQCRTQADCTFGELRSGAECSCGPDGCALTAGSSCAAAAECGSGICAPSLAGEQICCVLACGEGLRCSSDGARCVACDADGARCEGNVSQLCAGGVLTSTVCGNGCDASTGRCSPQRPTGSVCQESTQCQSGACTLDVTGTQRCCDAACAASGRACAADGSCVCPAGREDVNGVCLLGAGQSCAAGSDCASGACVGRVAGGSVCCAQPCGGSFCSADGSSCIQCEGEGSVCQGNASARCEDGQRIPTTCGNGCNATTGVCNGLLPNGQACTAGAQCASTLCAADVNGTQRCCAANCAATGRVCGADGSCVCPDPSEVFLNGACRSVEGQGCATDGDCRSGACEPTQNGARVCCTGACNGQLCRASGQGCVQCEGNGSTCQGNASRSCVNNAFVTTSCANGCNPATGQCNALIARGGTGCTGNNQCAGNGAACVGGRCCEFNCAAAGQLCDSSGGCQCPAGTTARGNACLLAIGSACDPSRPSECVTGRCNQWFVDFDRDSHGDPARPDNRCGNIGEPAPAGLAAVGDDCCDSSADTFPGATQGASTQPNACGSFDRDCSAGQVVCGASSCNIDDSTVCCARHSATIGAIFSCESRSACPSRPLLPLPSSTPVECDDADDCPGGTICCLTAANGDSRVTCLAVDVCHRDESFVSRFQACVSPTSTTTCANGRACGSPNDGLFPGWRFCDSQL